MSCLSTDRPAIHFDLGHDLSPSSGERSGGSWSWSSPRGRDQLDSMYKVSSVVSFGLRRAEDGQYAAGGFEGGDGFRGGRVVGLDKAGEQVVSPLSSLSMDDFHTGGANANGQVLLQMPSIAVHISSPHYDSQTPGFKDRPYPKTIKWRRNSRRRCHCYASFAQAQEGENGLALSATPTLSPVNFPPPATAAAVDRLALV